MMAISWVLQRKSLFRISIRNKGESMIKKKSIDYIFGMITGASLMLAFQACTNTPLGASGSTVQEVKVVNESWDAVYIRSAD